MRRDGASGDGGNLELVAGDSKATDGVGGKLSLFGGNSIHTNGGNGGGILFQGGLSLASESPDSEGGNVSL